MTGELLPHLFTLSPEQSRRGGYFLLHYYTLADIFPLGSMALYVVRTFLSPLRLCSEENDETACCNAKIRKTVKTLKFTTFENSKSPPWGI